MRATGAGIAQYSFTARVMVRSCGRLVGLAIGHPISPNPYAYPTSCTFFETGRFDFSTDQARECRR